MMWMGTGAVHVLSIMLFSLTHPVLALAPRMLSTSCSRGTIMSAFSSWPRLLVSRPADRLSLASLQLLACQTQLRASSSHHDNNRQEEASALLVNDKPKKKKINRTQLKNELKQYRMQQSGHFNKPAYTVFPNAALEGIYNLLPTTKEELLQVKGIGPKKLDMFGDDILSIVSKYVTGSAGYDSDKDSSAIKQASPLMSGRPANRMIDPATLTAEQRRAADLALGSDHQSNIFITGSAGTGKSHVLKFVVNELQKRGSKFGVCAPTGVASINVGGSTLHSFFGIGLGTGSLSSLIKKVNKNKEAKKRIDETNVLVIDECSMLSSDLIETLDSIVREVRKDGQFIREAFGGMQVIAFGDFFQLPPIYRGGDGHRDWRPFCFDSTVWSDLGLTENMVELVEVQRQGNDEEFVDLLNKVRIGDIQESDVRDLNSRCLISDAHPLPTDGILPTRLYVLNKDVDSENEARLAELKGEEVVCKARNMWRENMPTGTLVSVKKNMVDSLSKEMPEEVRLKVGAQVMLTRNKDLERNLVNGSRGVVERFVTAADGETLVPVVRFDCGLVTSIAKVEAVRYNPEGREGCLVRTQIPLKLAWALTVHKSQGTTLTRALLDVSSSFEYGQCYVALSRVKSLDGLWLERPARLRNIMVSPQVLDFYRIK